MSILTDDEGKTFLSIFPTLSYEDRLVSLRELTAIPQPVEDTTALLLQLAQQSSEEDLLRIEALKVIGLYADQSQQPMIMRGIRELLSKPDEDDDVQNAALQTLAWMPCSEAELRLALDIICSDTYILVKGAAFALLRANKAHPFALHALKQLLQHEEFGASAKRELST
ncbi:HEAT repeat domain-containing protein [Paenibacillus polymyxa]|uniref:HEAT repeat domain-containing protein n=1 Tax=Paenibacillus polymyxa TaxID=1406 RepID=UPI000F89550D|nr:HEAT repeat domain-containing protein [Paenibacillus polymyxa]QDA27294.1 HEAT repeat domain-containing protein [Paenibacillus polymyxa]RTZ34507.1 HEAT repeat domain-containing protein [Paenibacillus polymyxa]UQQ35017.1 HEAT repeat domain-containing protein [Paenibacillus polymyxa]URJ36092.1 HEAT repeat domain-containing protein [Paenibacillus polymyxa]